MTHKGSVPPSNGGAMSKTTATRARPLSPHLQIYKPIPTMMMSIIHRITGCALYFGTLLVAIWLMAARSEFPCRTRCGTTGSCV